MAPPQRTIRRAPGSPGVFITIDGHAALLLGEPDETLGDALDEVLRPHLLPTAWQGRRVPRKVMCRRAWQLHDEALRPVPETTKFSELSDDVHLFTHTRDP